MCTMATSGQRSTMRVVQMGWTQWYLFIYWIIGCVIAEVSHQWRWPADKMHSVSILPLWSPASKKKQRLISVMGLPWSVPNLFTYTQLRRPPNGQRSSVSHTLESVHYIQLNDFNLPTIFTPFNSPWKCVPRLFYFIFFFSYRASIRYYRSMCVLTIRVHFCNQAEKLVFGLHLPPTSNAQT